MRNRTANEKEQNKLRMRVVGLDPDYRSKRALYAKVRKDRRKYWINKYKAAKGCRRCNFKGPHYCYDFHHIEPSGKDFELNSSSLLCSLKRIFIEMRKCELLCSNCHRIVHMEKYCGA